MIGGFMNQAYNPNWKPKEHQREFIERMTTGSYANFDDQGMGKCKQAYDLGGELLAKNEIDLVIIIAKASLRDNFYKEISKDAYQLVPTLISGNKNERRLKYKYLACHILIISFENAVSDEEFIKNLIANNRTYLCMDEAHYIKNPCSQRTKACLRIAENAVKTAIFTGTPIPNKPQDIYPQLKFLKFDVGESPLEFKERFKNLADLKAYLNGISIRRKKTDIEELGIPEKEVSTIQVDLSPAERTIYNKLSNDLILEMRDRFKQIKTIPVSHLLTKLLRLNQLTSNPHILSENYEFTGSKIIKLDEIVNQAVREGRKIIIWTSYRRNITFLMDRYKDLGITSIYGDHSKEEISRNADEFQDGSKYKILVAIPACAREGFTFTSSNIAVFLDRSFSLLDWQQSQDRIHRIGQTQKCEIIVLEAKDTVDQRVDELLERKAHLQRYLLGESDIYEKKENITYDEFISFLTAELESVEV